jgi:hypothetical protein
VDIPQIGLGRAIVGPVDAVLGTAVAEEMLAAGHHAMTAEEIRGTRITLETPNHLAGIGARDLGVLGPALVGTPPPIVTDNRHGRAEIPVEAGHRHLDRGHPPDLVDQPGVSGGAETDVLRKDGGAEYVGVAVNGVGSPDDRNRHTAVRGIHRRFPEGIGQRQPVVHRGPSLAIRLHAAAVEDRAETVLANILWFEMTDFALNHLSDLVLDR